ncbi:MAG: nucleotidyltransferase family protein [[Clostridium] spiroforme]|uniref:Nucleotidyltransferase family protein n=1 Tax=Thomasclavelia spiroformis TaxID=29348 RepID=A0A943EJQ2_9FIRM|nr:nucleotidyltransferase family protein [Thomasclavelia spiroformis]MBS5589251.1 nucleotidyltransferase family protein [Thomasclavelia spiroformis]
MKTYIIYLAAGNSRRFGTNKLFYKINDKELYRYGLDNLIKLVSMRNDCKLIVVTQYFEITKTYPELDYVYSSKCKDGISHSIKAGLEMINEQDNFQVMFVVADQINLNYQTLNKMLDNYNVSNYSLATLSYQNKVGNPTIFDCKYVDELKRLKGEHGGRKILNKYLERCLFFEVDDHKELFDIDFLEDLNNDITSDDL